ncbi:MAG: lamin tail domain-containing protein [Phycisphaerales bacterium]|nr:lamin tail domain-containing protein [Phycisphaerales bacterium]
MTQKIRGGILTVALCIAFMSAFGLSARSANAAVVINEVLGSTTSTDTEYIELYNTGPGMVDISGWEIELWDSDVGPSFGLADGDAPYVIPAATSIAVGGYYLLASPEAAAQFGVTADLALPDDSSIENSSYTIILTDGTGGTVIDSFFVTDGDAGDEANRMGTTPFTPTATIGPDGTFLPAGFYRIGDGGGTFALLEFSPRPAPSGTPGAANLGSVATGACCNGAVCTPDQTQVDCENGGGIWEGTNSVCTPNPCGPTGACCAADFSTCTNLLTQEECTALDPTATWLQDEFCNLACGPEGSCCIFDGTCVDGVTEAECQDMQGHQFLENDTCPASPPCISSAVLVPAPIIISEYYESEPGNRKAIEIYNTSDMPQSLNGHSIRLYSSPNPTPNSVFTLDGLTIGAHDVLVFINSADADDEIPGLDESLAIVASSAINFNGNDAVDIAHGDLSQMGGPAITIIDRFGAPPEPTGDRGANPYQDAAWERNCSVTSGTDMFDPCNFDGLKNCAAAAELCPPATPVDMMLPCFSQSDTATSNEWTYEGDNDALDNDNHSLGSHLCVAGEAACCLPGDICIITDATDCANQGGTFFADTPCNPLPCGPTGSCCETNVFCFDNITQSQCAAASATATFTQGGSCAVDCPAEGACCRAGTRAGLCSCPGDLNGDQVVDLNDLPLFVAELISATPDICADVNEMDGANGGDIQAFIQLVLDMATCDCVQTTEANCLASGGTYQGDLSVCDPTPCGPKGACCAADFGSCTDDLTFEECTALDNTATWTEGAMCNAVCVAVEVQSLVINEIWSDSMGNDGDDAEYIELFCPSCGGTALNGLSLIVIDGDTGGNEGSASFRRVNQNFDLSGMTMPLDGYFVIGGGTTPNVDLSIDPLPAFGAIQNGSQTYAIVRNSDLEIMDNDLTEASVLALSGNTVDAVALDDGTPGDHSYLGAPVITPDEFAPGQFAAWDTVSRIPNGQDTDTGLDTGAGEDWCSQNNFALLLFDSNDELSSPGTENMKNAVGVCCIPNPPNPSICQETTKAACTGIWQGRDFAGLLCSNPILDLCNPFGACCVEDGSCVLANQENCENALLLSNGVYQGDGTTCDPLPCGPTGSCCEPDFNCTDGLTMEECAAVNANATWTEAGTCAVDCIEPTGACCLSNDMSGSVLSLSCEDVPPFTQPSCEQMGGIYLGDGSDCMTDSCPSEAVCLIISEVVDATLPQGLPKYVELTNIGTMTIDLSGFTIGNYNNGSPNLGGGSSTALSGMLAAGDSYVISYEGGDSPGMGTFFDTYGFDPDNFDLGAFINGNDAIALFFADGTGANGEATGDGSDATLADLYGVIGTDGAGQNWEYTDSYSVRLGTVSSGNFGTFNEAEWTLNGPNFLETGDDLTELPLIQMETTPGTHDFTATCGEPPVVGTLVRCCNAVGECDPTCDGDTEGWCVYTVTTVISGCNTIGMGSVFSVECIGGSCDALGTEETFTWVDENGVGQNCTFTATRSVFPACSGTSVGPTLNFE